MALHFRPFNFAVRCVQAALVTRGVEAVLIESTTTDADYFVERIEALQPDIVGFSTYAWSFGTFLEVAERIKRRFPKIVTVFGGPSARAAMFALDPFVERRWCVDALVEGEGEEVIAQIVALPTIDSTSLLQIPGVSVPSNDGWRRDRPAEFIRDLDSLASPYALDLVPRGVMAHLETFRGCPLACAFCQWGDGGTASRTFGVDAIAAKLNDFRRLELTSAVLVDAGLNLNARAFRALVAAEKQTRALQHIALDFDVYPSHLKPEHLEFISEICVGSIGIGLQSYDQAVLKRLKRSFDPIRFEEVTRQLAAICPDIVIEIILGLPGDTPETFRDTLERARRLPCDVRVFHCLVLPDALMTRSEPWAAMDFDPITLRMRSCAGWSARDLASMRDELSRRAEECGGRSDAQSWLFPREPYRTPVTEQRLKSRGFKVDAAPEFTLALMGVIARATNGRWAVRRTVRAIDDKFRIEVAADGVEMEIELDSAANVTKAFVIEDGVAISYRKASEEVSSDVIAELRKMAPALAKAYLTHDKSAAGHQLPIIRSVDA